MSKFKEKYTTKRPREYIPIGAGWEIQTKGEGSTFRISNTITGEQIMINDERIHDRLEKMAQEINKWRL